MTETDWLASTDPRPMLRFLRGKASERKLRLFACGFCYSIEQLVADEDCSVAVQVAERFADGLASPEELEAACLSARLVWAACWKGMLAAEAAAAGTWRAASGVQAALEMDDIPRTLWKRQSDLLRDLFGNPFRPVAFNPAWRTPHVLSFAQAIYEERAFDRILELADALEAAGCSDAALLAHCRGPGPHVRGCWPLDAVLGKA